ncbi:MAG: carbohydrate binding domain-containing protein [Spirochaetes bacterium]|nr:carbohydrate binding domain-containing protein [Spirochaetota bacterium]
MVLQHAALALFRIGCISFLIFGAGLFAETTLMEWNFSAMADIPESARHYFNDKSGVKTAVSIDREAAAPDGKGALRIDVLAASQKEEGGDIQQIFSYANGLQAKKKYRVTITMKANHTMMMPVKLVSITDGSPWSGVANPDGMYVTLNREWKTIKYTFTSTGDFSGKAVRTPGIFMGEFDTGTTIWIARVIFTEVQ